MLLYAIAFLAGIVTAISPCVYPVLPIIFAGGASGGRRRPYAIIAGLVVTFARLAALRGWLLDQLGLPQDFLRKLSIGFLLLFAATLLFPPLARAIERPLLRFTRRPSGDLGGGFLLGASLGLALRALRRAGARLHHDADREPRGRQARRARGRLRARRGRADAAARARRPACGGTDPSPQPAEPRGPGGPRRRDGPLGALDRLQRRQEAPDQDRRLHHALQKAERSSLHAQAARGSAA